MENIKKTTALETLSMRYDVLRKGKSIETCQFEADDLPVTIILVITQTMN